jgi:hypothetical protein
VAILTRAFLVMVAVVSAADVSAAQDVTQRAYLRAVAGYFQVSETEIAILGHGGGVPAEEIPVVLFIARRGGVSPEAVVALREAGRPWPELAQRFGVGANALHVPMSDAAQMGTLGPLYERFRVTPVDQWPTMRLDGVDIVALVNVRVLSQALGIPPDQIAQRTGTVPAFVDLYATFLR